MCLVLVDDDIILYVPVLLDRLYLLFYVTQTYFIWHVSPSPPPPFSVLFRPGESVHLTSSVPGNRSTFFHPLGAITMTTLNNRQRRGWMMSQSTKKNKKREEWRRRGQAVNDEKNGDSGGKRLDSPRSHTKWSTRMILTQSVKTVFSFFFFFLMPPFFLKEQKKTQSTRKMVRSCVWYGPEWRQLILHCD